MKTYNTKKEIADAVLRFGTYGKLYAKSVYNKWNAWVKGVYYNKQSDTIWVDVYVQGDDTDTDTSVRYESFVSDGDYCGSAEGIRYRLSQAVREEFLKGLYDTIERLKGETDEDRRKKELRSWKYTNPVVDRLYDTIGLRHKQYFMHKCPEYTRYCEAKRVLSKYIEDHIDQIAKLDETQVSELYWSVIWDAYLAAKG